MSKPSGYVIYRGPSLLDGSPIVAIVSGVHRGSKNSKTGSMVQTYILRSDMHPIQAARSGSDVAICGDCKHRPTNQGTCYVNLTTGVGAVWRGFDAGSCMDVDAELVGEMCTGRMVRLGTYGDPAAVPVEVWEALIAHAKGSTGYTHQWRKAEALMPLVMASVDSRTETVAAQSRGWRTFRVRIGAGDALFPRESVCPASEEGGRKLECSTCGACNGTRTGRKGSIAIIVHGLEFKRKRFEALAAA